MKLTDKITNKLIELEVDGAKWYMKPLTISQVKALQKEFKKLEENNEDLSPLMVLFTDVLVGDDGQPFEEILDPTFTFDKLCDLIPINTLLNLSDAITKELSGKKSGN